MKPEPKLWVPEPPWWVFSIVGAIVSAWLVVQLMVWLGDLMLDWGDMTKIGQIDMFTRRIRKPPDPLERELHIAVADTLRKGGLSEGWICFHPANGEDRKDNTGALLKRMGVLPGVSDLIFIAPPYGRVHALELKRRGKKPTQEQRDFMGAVTVAGGIADWCDNYEDAIKILTHWGAMHPRMHIIQS